jgi:hypothetical protein
MRLIICGSRDGVPWELVWDELDHWLGFPGISAIIEGCARGVDRHAEEWAAHRNVTIHHCPADWGQHGRAAGAIRNRGMLTLHPSAVLAFYADASKPSKGTADMVRAARQVGVATYEINASASGVAP